MPFIPASNVAAVLALVLCTACAGSAPPETAAGPSAPAAAEPGGSGPDHWTMFTEDGPESLTRPAAPYTSGAVSTEAAGSFQIVEEKDAARTRLRLVFTTADRLAYVLLQDDGSGVTIDVQVPGCFSTSRYYQYRDREDETHLYKAMANHLETRLSNCPHRVSAAEQYQREFRRASADFPEAIRAFKAKAMAVFTGLEARCRTPAGRPFPSASYERCQ
jgi:hypothetical protein